MTWELPAELRGDALARVRMIATDIDGTLLDTGQPIAPRTVAAVRALIELGIEVVPVTGRPLRWVLDVYEQISELHWAIATNGATVLDMRARQLHSAHFIPAQVSVCVIDAVRKLEPRAAFAFETVEGSFVEEEFLAAKSGDIDSVKRRQSAPKVVPGTLHTVDGQPVPPVFKMLVRVPGVTDTQALLDTLAPAFGTQVHATHSSPNSGLLELALAGITKACTLHSFAQERGIGPHQVAAFGDMPNDVEMLEWAGLSFAMADGHPVAHRAAKFMAPPLSHGGIAPVLEAIAQVVRKSR